MAEFKRGNVIILTNEIECNMSECVFNITGDCLHRLDGVTPNTISCDSYEYALRKR